MFWFLVFLGCLLFASAQPGLLDDPHAMQALNDHGDRITDLEKLVQNLTSRYTDLLTEINRVTAKNVDLEQQLKVFNKNCSLTCDTHYSHQHTQTTTKAPCHDTTHPVSCDVYAASGACRSMTSARNAGCMHFCRFC